MDGERMPPDLGFCVMTVMYRPTWGSLVMSFALARTQVQHRRSLEKGLFRSRTGWPHGFLTVAFVKESNPGEETARKTLYLDKELL